MEILIQNLLHGLSPMEEVRQKAEAQLLEYQQKDIAAFTLALLDVLLDENQQTEARHMAGICLKNAFVGRSYEVQKEKENQWLSLSEETKATVRQRITTALSAQSPSAYNVASQVVAAVGAIDLKNGAWGNLITELSEVGRRADVPVTLKIASVQAIGYLCDVLDPDLVTVEQTDQVLTAIVAAMEPSSNNTDLILAGTSAMLNTIDFATKNFKSQTERQVIMKAILVSAHSQNAQIRIRAFQCIGRIVSDYYLYLSDCMTDLYNVTLQTIRNDTQQEVALQAVEFWCTLCEEELDLICDLEDGLIQNPEEGPKYFVRHACAAENGLLDALLWAIQQQEEDQDDDSWTLSMAAGTCLALVSQTIKDAIVPKVVAFVTENVRKAGPENWRQREAAVLAFGSMLDGPSTESLQRYVMQGLEFLVSMLNPANEPNVVVRDTTAWAISMICDHHLEQLSPEVVGPLVNKILQHLNDKPQVVRNLCYSLYHVAEMFRNKGGEPSNALSPMFDVMMQKLFEVTNRPDWQEFNIRSNAYEAIIMLIENVGQDRNTVVLQFLNHIQELLQKANQTMLHGYASSAQKEEVEGLQVHLCATILVTLNRIGAALSEAQIDGIMQLMLEILSKGSPAQSDAFFVVGAVADQTAEKFTKYMQHLFPLLQRGLENRSEYQICKTAVGVVGDVCRAIGADIEPYVQQVIQILLLNLKDPSLNRSVKPMTLSIFGDIALAIAGKFQPYVPDVVGMLLSAASTQVPAEDEELADYVYELQEYILESFSGIIQGMNVPEMGSANPALCLLKCYRDILSFIAFVSKYQANPDYQVPLVVVKNAIAVLGDLVSVLGPEPKGAVASNSANFRPLIECGQNSQDSTVVQLTKWTTSVCK